MAEDKQSPHRRKEPSKMLNKLRTRAATEGGFTLIELLIVMVILGILATIVLFATGTFTTDSKKSALCANARILTIAEAAYAASHSGSVSDHSAAQLGTYLSDPFPTTNVPTAPAVGATTWTGTGC
jgi:general secretion pathway protein G